MANRTLWAMVAALSLIAAACGTGGSEVAVAAEPLRGFDGEIVVAGAGSDGPVAFASDGDDAPVATTTTTTPPVVPATEPEPTNTRLGTAPVLPDDLENEGCSFVTDEQVNAAVDPAEGHYGGILGITRFGSCTYINYPTVENTVHIDVAPIQRGAFFDARFLSQYHAAGNLREVSEEAYGDESYLFRDPVLGPEISVNIDGVFVRVRILPLDDNSDEAARIEDAREIIEIILNVN